MITHEGITCQFKSLEKMTEKSIFLQIFLTNLQENSHVICEFLVVDEYISQSEQYIKESQPIYIFK